MISKSEYLRKVIHLFNLIIPISYYYLFPEKWEFLTIIIYATLFIILIDIARNFIPFIQSIFSILFNDMLREHELKGKLTGSYIGSYFYEYRRYGCWLSWEKVWKT